MQVVERSLHAREQQQDIGGNEVLRARQGRWNRHFRGRGRLNRHFEGRGWLNRRFGGFRRLPTEWARINTKSGYTNMRQRGQIGDSEVKDIFLTMRLVGLNYYVC